MLISDKIRYAGIEELSAFQCKTGRIFIRESEGDRHMTFQGFQPKDFETFSIAGLDERMKAIQQRIQPKFQAIYEDIADEIDEITGIPLHLHIARHARRTVNPPADTWSAYCHNKRGYKKHPHFQVGLWHDHVFVWLAYIYELPGKEAIGKMILSDLENWKSILPEHYHASNDHMKNEAELIKDADFNAIVERFTNIKKGELLIGRRFEATDDIVKNGDRLISEIKSTIKTLTPLYRASMNLKY